MALQIWSDLMIIKSERVVENVGSRKRSQFAFTFLHELSEHGNLRRLRIVLTHCFVVKYSGSWTKKVSPAEIQFSKHHGSR